MCAVFRREETIVTFLHFMLYPVVRPDYWTLPTMTGRQLTVSVEMRNERNVIRWTFELRPPCIFTLSPFFFLYNFPPLRSFFIRLNPPFVGRRFAGLCSLSRGQSRERRRARVDYLLIRNYYVVNPVSEPSWSFGRECVARNGHEAYVREESTFSPISLVNLAPADITAVN